MKRYILPVVITVLVSAFFVTAPASSSEKEVVAKVGDRIITLSDLKVALKSYKPPTAYHNVTPEKMQQFSKDALNELIDIELLHKEAMKRGVKVPDSVVKEVIEENIQRLGSKKNLKGMLKNKGKTLDEFREEVKKHQMVILLMDDIKRDAEYKDEELRRYYEKNKSRFKRPESLRLHHIVIKVDPGAADDDWEKRRLYAEEVLQKIKSGEPFEDVAYNYSEDAYKVKSGDYGFVHKGQLEPVVEEAAFALKEGELSGVIRSIFGFHIIKGGMRKPQATMTYDEIKEKTMKELKEKRFKENYDALLDRLREEYPVAIYINTDG